MSKKAILIFKDFACIVQIFLSKVTEAMVWGNRGHSQLSNTE